MSSFWSLWIIVLTVICISGVCWLLFANRKSSGRVGKDGEPPTTGHVYDGIQEYDNPLPAWWFNMFVLSILFAIGYLALMPGLGNFPGLLGWTSIGQWEEEVAEADAKYAPVFDAFLSTPVETLAQDPKAMKMGARVFANNCAICHGNNGRGNFGFPNLQDQDWLYGGNPEQIKQSITYGRKGMMPAWGKVLKDEQLQAVAAHVLSLSGKAEPSAQGKQVYATYCVACHGQDGSGNQMMGAPRLSDDTWLYGGSSGEIIRTIRLGRNGVMPAHAEQLSEAKIHLLTAYVWSLSSTK